MRTLLFAAALLALPMLEAQTKTHHVVFVITAADHDDWHTGMVLADHYLAGIHGQPAEVEVLVYGPGIEVLKGTSPESKSIADLEKQGVRFVACQSAMRAFHIAPAELAPGVTSVPSGVVELVDRQEAGYAYVKVGR